MNGNREMASSEFGLRWRIVVDPKKEKAARWFAGLELVLLPLSFVTFGYVVLDAVLSPCGVSLSACLPPAFARWVLPVLVAGAIGYVTNWLAILMLFKPYERKPWYWGWRQGLIPQNKAKIARQVGEQVCTELLPPAALVAEFTQEVQAYLSRPDVIGKVKALALEMFGRHEKEIVDFLVPQIESAADGLLNRLMTSERIRAFWDETLAPRLKDPQTRQFMAEKVVGAIKDNAPELVRRIRDQLSAHLRRKVAAAPLVGDLGLTDGIVGFVMDWFADEPTIRRLFADWLDKPATQDMFRDRLLLLGEKTSEWMNSPQGRAQLARFTDDLRGRGGAFMADYLHGAIPALVSRVFASEKLWSWIEYTALPNLKGRLLGYLSENSDFLVRKLRIAERIEEAINAQDIAHFHRMLNDLAAQHLSAIQVLGYVLGVAVGLIQLAA